MPICELLKKRGLGGLRETSRTVNGVKARCCGWTLTQSVPVFKFRRCRTSFHRAETQPCVWDRNQSEQVFAEIEQLNAAGDFAGADSGRIAFVCKAG